MRLYLPIPEEAIKIMNELSGGSEKGKRTETRRPIDGRGPTSDDLPDVVLGRPEPKPVSLGSRPLKKTSDNSGLTKEPPDSSGITRRRTPSDNPGTESIDPPPAKKPPDSSGITRRRTPSDKPWPLQASIETRVTPSWPCEGVIRQYRPPHASMAWEVELTGLVGSTKVPALLIPPDDSRPVTMTEFDLDKIWRCEAVDMTKNRVFLTEKYADLDHRKNRLAIRHAEHHSDAAKDPNSRPPSPEKLHGNVYVVARDPLTKWITRSTTQLDKLKHALEWHNPFRPTD